MKEILNYNPIFLGEDCEAPFRFKQLKCNFQDGPFNHVGVSYERLLELLNNNFEDYILEENLFIEKKITAYKNSYKKNNIRIVEKIKNKISLEIWHNFNSEFDFKKQYNSFKEEYLYKQKKMINTIKNDISPILFIFKKTDIDSIINYDDIKNQCLKLNQAIKKNRGDKKYILAFIGKHDIFKEFWGIENVINFKINSPKLWGKNDIIDNVWLQLCGLCNKSNKIFI